MKRIFRNALRVVSQPEIGMQYAVWVLTRAMRRRSPIVRFYRGVCFSEFASFSEYWLRHRGLDPEDLRVIEAVRATGGKSAAAVDVGANLGLFSLALAKAGFDEVLAFEPMPETYRRFQANLGLNSDLQHRIITSPKGLGARDSRVQFSFNSISPGQSKMLDRSGPSNENNVVECEVITLESLLKARNWCPILFLKMDVEGFESDILKGGMSVLREGKVGFIYAEVIPEALAEAGSSTAEFTRLIEDAGFDPVILDLGSNTGFQRVEFDAALAAASQRRNLLFRSRNYQFS